MKNLTANIKVENVARSLEFYRDILEFESVISLPAENPEWVLLRNGDAQLMIHQKESINEEYPLLAGKSGGALILYAAVDDVFTLHERIKDKVNIIKPLIKTHYGRNEFSVTDPDGFIITFSS